MINFKNGQPSADLLPTQLFSEAAQKALSAPHAAVDMLQYGHELGHPEFLRNLATFLTNAYHSPVYSQHLCATAGASLSLQHILSILTRPETHTRHVYLQDPTYFLVFDIFLDVGYTRDQWVGIPEEGDSGMRLDLLEDHLAKHYQPNDSTTFSSVLYCVPTHANPTGSILSAEKRQRLVELGKKYNMLIICDDVYDILTFEGDIPKRLVAYDLESQGKSVVISNGSFSKLLAPGARVGWIEANERLIQRVGAW
ncbi:pyridoxal phosphate-dependent transferase [Gilbertella persicaria]|uniref:pyridoxal phosphate-dependent transferase n=1 Tax=Gilbertella persicaria TaxID=101096 RepID=UPI0022202372|nr:pyridoxal phosphate-dependent transferase [Gilbertella persicaria]KAI8091027.1 pyridoxal phosphate-dependent transferase [Gilbertella persicaria]